MLKKVTLNCSFGKLMLLLHKCPKMPGTSTREDKAPGSRAKGVDNEFWILQLRQSGEVLHNTSLGWACYIALHLHAA